MSDLPDLVPPSGRGANWPVEGSTEIWEADFMDFRPDLGLDRSRWPEQNRRDLVVEFPVRKGEIPNEVVWEYADQHLKRPFRGNLRRVR